MRRAPAVRRRIRAAYRGIDFAGVQPLDRLLVVFGPLALIFSFFDYYVASVKGPELTPVCRAGFIPCSESDSAWHGFFGWFGVLMLLVVSVGTALAVLAAQDALPTRMIAAGAAAVGFLFTFIALFVIPHANPSYLPPGHSITDYVEFGHGFSYWVILVVAAAATVVAIVRVERSGGSSGTPQLRRAGWFKDRGTLGSTKRRASP
jgi:hypothetical protein